MRKVFSSGASGWGLGLGLMLVACGGTGAGNSQATGEQSAAYSAQVLRIASRDGTHLVTNVLVPKGAPGQRFPAVVFVNSWTLGSYEYLAQAEAFAREGYIALSYSTRGFGLSEGVVNVAGPQDMEDLAAELDWLEANTPVDREHIGMTGISYGGGISLLGLSTEPRIKTAVSMSGFTDLVRALDGNDTPRLVWGLLLVGSGYFTGRMDPVIAQDYVSILKGSDLTAVKSWAQDRSPINFVAQLNAANKPVYLSNNLSDDLFEPNPVLDYFAQLTVPKRLDLNRGEHFTAEVSGLLGDGNNYVWKNAHDWFGYWLKGVDTGIMKRPPVSIERKLASGRVELDGWPASNVTDRIFYLAPRGLLTQGRLSDTPNTTSATTRIWSGLDTLATSGFPLLSAVLEAHADVPTYLATELVDRVHGVVYQTDALDQGLAIRGKLTLHARIAPSGGTAGLVAYFYDLDPLGLGRLMTLGTVTVRNGAPGAETDVDLDAAALVHDLAPGHRLAVAVDTADVLFAPPTLDLYAVDFLHGPDAQSTLDVQVAAAP